MTGTKWIIEGTVDPRWPINTRGNIGEVFPEVITSLSYELGVVHAERAWRDAYRDLGILAEGDFATDQPVIIGLYGGYCYLNLSYLRMMGVRAPGSSAEAIDVAFFGEGDPPPYEPRRGDKSLRSSIRILRTVLGALGTTELPEVVGDSFRRVASFEARRPALDAPDEELLAYLESFPEAFRPVFGNHMKSTAIAAIVSGILADACAAAGEPGLVTHLIGASGDVRSARYAQDLYEVAGLVRSNPELMAQFDQGIDGLLDRLDGEDSGPAAEFGAAFAGFIDEHGHRGPNDWEFSARTWENTPSLALAALDSMRRADHDLSPSTRLGDDEAKRAAAIAAVRPHLSFLDRRNFDKAITAVPFWSQAREATRDRAVRVIFPAKQVYWELVRRGAERGGDPDPVRVALLSPSTELRQYLADPASMTEVLAERAALYARYAAVEPRFFITAQGDVPTIEELEAEQEGASEVAAAGAVLTGNAGCSGTATGRARVVLDPADGAALEPGEILVAPLTDPAWTPLFLPAAAVVVNVGALMSHAVIVARELGIPCVVAVDGATDRIETGMFLEVDGTAGTVTVLEGEPTG
ncbi:MAG: PEP-utilizing enzyme [Actinomycetota bacterium]